MPPDPPSSSSRVRPAAPVPAASSDALPTAREWPDLARRLTKYAHFKLGKSSWATAEDIAQQAILHFLDPAYAAWDRERHPDAFDCLGHLVNGIVANHWRKKAHRAKHVSLRDDDRPHDDELPEPLDGAPSPAPIEDEDAPPPPPDDSVLLTDDRTPDRPRDESARADAGLAALRARLAGDTLALALIELISSGVGSAAAQARALDVPIADVYLAKRRVNHHARLVAETLEGGES